MAQPPSFSSFPGGSSSSNSNSTGEGPTRQQQQQPQSFSSFPQSTHSKRKRDESAKSKSSSSSKRDKESTRHNSDKKRKHESHQLDRDQRRSRPESHSTSTSSKDTRSRPSSHKNTTAQPLSKPSLLQTQLAVYPRRPAATSSTTIISDTAGDPDFTRYGALNASDVPRFRRTGAGRVLGAPVGLRIIKTQRGSKRLLTLLPPNQARRSRYTDQNRIESVSGKHSKVYQLLPGASRTQASIPEDQLCQAPFIHLLEEDIEKPPDPLADPDYRDLGNDPNAGDDASSSSEADSDHLDGQPEDDRHISSVLGQGRSYLDQLTLKNAELSAQVREQPQDIQAWLDFVAHQDVFLSNTRADFALQLDRTAAASSSAHRKSRRKREERRAIAETKLDILAKALSKNKDAADLVRARLRVGEVVWTEEELSKEWERALRKAGFESDNNVLWQDWVAWRTREARAFRVRDEPVDAAQKAIANLKSFPHRLGVFDQTVRCLRSAAYHERANGAYQALMELHFFCPPSLQGASFDERVSELELFWEAEAPRFGFPGALGWGNTDTNNIPEAPPPTEAQGNDLSTQIQLVNTSTPEDKSPFGHWAAQETKVLKEHRFSISVLDVPDEEEAQTHDPYQYTQFNSEVQPLLFDLDHPQTDRTALLFSYLAFLGVGTLQPGQSTNDVLPPDDVLTPQAIARFFPVIPKRLSFEVIGGEPMEAVRQSGLQSPADGWGRHWPAMHELFLPALPGSGWPSYWQHQDWSSTETSLIQSSLQQILAAKLLDESMTRFFKILFFSLEAGRDSKAAAKLAKQLLASDQQHLLLWDAYARLEASRGKIKEARHVYSQTAAALHTFPPEQQIDNPIFWHGWAELEWQVGSHPRAIQVLAASTRDTAEGRAQTLRSETLNPDQITKVAQAFADQLRKLRQGSLGYSHAVVANAALFAYLTEGLKSSCAIFEECCYDAKPIPGLQERLYTMYTKMLYYHTKQQAYQPALLRDVLVDALAQFPNNSLFLNLYFHNESRTRIQNRVRALLDRQLSSTGQSTTPSSWIFRIFVELHLDARGYSAEGVRHLFEQAVSALQTRPSVAIWQLFLQFALVKQDGLLIRSVVLRAVQECPAAKDLYLLAFSAAGKATLPRSEASELYGSLQERQLRCFTGIKDFLDIDSLQFNLPDDEEAEADGEMDVDDAFRNLADKQKLMPY